ncbi:MAG TPA: hypothetical protein VGX37_09265 [Allosphingosinicella sp.]|nr:hypothetical protein [Allosphingosinicella sp.]
MKDVASAPIAALLLILAAPAAAEEAPAQQTAQEPAATGPALGTDLFFSTDGDHTDVLRIGADFDLRYSGPEDYLGLRLEKAWFDPLGQGVRGRERAYLRAADSFAGGAWKWSLRIGTDGHTVLGAAALHNEAALRQEYFIEREIVETPQGLERGIYYTFAGAAIDLPADERNVFTVFGGVQPFTGDNVRFHLRANFVHVVKPEWGLSAQLRTRYFANTEPGEFDYYSPRWYAQLLPVVQVRRFDRGWRYLLAAGLGVQRDSQTGWRRSSYFNAQGTSPERRGWAVQAALLYSETPTTAGLSYDYLQVTVGLRRGF